MALWNNKFEYNEELLGDIEEKIDHAYDKADGMNDSYENTRGQQDHFKVCQCCGAIIVNDVMGFGCKCYDTIKKLLPIIAKYNKDFELKLSEYNLNKWHAYAETIRNIYIDINSKDGQPKKFKSDFKKSFFASMQNADRFSSKQVDIMIKDIDNYCFYNKDDKAKKLLDVEIYNKSMMIKLFNTDKHYTLKNDFRNLLAFGDVIDFIRITYKKAWIDNPLDTNIEINMD